ncbi:MAG: hypothetical protein QOE37_2105, partial [Microbacteriaceae bacterium]|nr:hypothetical protein [Microbacteriaceae bacterium]
TIRSRLPLTWGAFCDGRFAWRAAALIADASTGLRDEPLAEYDRRAAELAEELPPHQLRNELERLRDRLDAAAAAERAEHAARSRHVAAAPEPDGQGSLTFRGPQTDVAAMYDAVRQIAVDAHGREGETRPLGALMFDAGADLILHGAANPPSEPWDPSTPAERLGDVRVPGRKAVQATLLVLAPAATACGEGQQPSALAGWGSLTAAETRRIVASTSTWTRVLVDPIDDAVLGIDSTERYIPAGLRKLLQARDQTCRGPGCNRPSHRCDADHTVRFEHGGHTGETNLAILCRPDHQAKDAGYLDVRRQPDGSLRWRTRWGATVVTKPALTVRRPPPTHPPF